MPTASVSVIIPTYNRARYINECIDSVLAQTHAPSEIFIVDDGSTDNTPDLVATYQDSRIRYVPMPHSGIAAAARNRGLALASCDFLAFLDSDDRWRNTMLEKQLGVLAGDESLACSFTNFARFRDDPYTVLNEQFTYCREFADLTGRLRRRHDGFILDGDAFSIFVGFYEFPAYLQCLMFRRSAISGMRMNESLRIGEDTDFVMRAFTRGKVALLPEVLADIRRHDSNITNESGMLIELDKVKALLNLREAADTKGRQAALRDRLVKGYIDGATALIRSGRRMEGLRYYSSALRISGSTKRKLKGLARTGLNLAASVTIRRDG